jgi:hypothetical protein
LQDSGSEFSVPQDDYRPDQSVAPQVAIGSKLGVQSGICVRASGFSASERASQVESEVRAVFEGRANEQGDYTQNPPVGPG